MRIVVKSLILYELKGIIFKLIKFDPAKLVDIIRNLFNFLQQLSLNYKHQRSKIKVLMFDVVKKQLLS